MKITAIVLAGGRGKRMGSDVPKQYIEVAGKPLLYYTLKAFEVSKADDIVIVCGEGDESFVAEEIIEKYGIKRVSAVVAGGKERYDSVYNGLKACRDAQKVLVHDGARCLVSPQLIDRVIDALDGCRAVIASLPVKDTIKRCAGCEVAATLKRSELVSVQTPQGFDYDLLLAANEKMYADMKKNGRDALGNITDDASIIEAYTGEKVKIVPGEEKNIKVTTPEDLFLVKMHLENLKKAVDKTDVF